MESVVWQYSYSKKHALFTSNINIFSRYKYFFKLSLTSHYVNGVLYGMCISVFSILLLPLLDTT